MMTYTCINIVLGNGMFHGDTKPLDNPLLI